MDMRKRLRRNAESVVDPDEDIQAVIPTQNVNPWLLIVLLLLGIVPLLILMAVAPPMRVIVVTDRRILLCRAGKVSSTTITGVQAEFARTTVLGPPRGVQYKCTALGGPQYVAMRFHPDVRQADALAGGHEPVDA